MHIPYRALLPRRVKGLLVAGRAIGGDRVAHAATHNMACCAVAGQGAGVAPALAIRSGRDPEVVDIAAIQAELRQGGGSTEGFGRISRLLQVAGEAGGEKIGLRLSPRRKARRQRGHVYDPVKYGRQRCCCEIGLVPRAGISRQAR